MQPEYNLYKREGFESGLQSLVRAQDMGVINYYALASGFLSGKYRSATDAGKRARPQDRRHLSERARPAHPEGAGRSGRGRELHAGPGRAGLADRAAGITSPIVSATSLEQLDELVKAASLTLSRDQLAKLSRASDWRV